MHLSLMDTKEIKQQEIDRAFEQKLSYFDAELISN
jgi:hypothetical protein